MYKRIMSVLLALVMLITLLPFSAFAAGVTYYQTSKADVPIWSSASSSSTKRRTISAKGTVLKVTGSTTNSSGNLWYQLNDGTWVFSGNVEKHSHSYTGGICNGNGCGYEYPLSVGSASGTFAVTNGNGAPIWSRPYSSKSTKVRTASYGTTMSVNGVTTNQEGHVWYRLTDGNWVYSGNVKQQFVIVYNANGGSGAPAAQYYLSGSSVTVPSSKPKRTGYIFKGWSTSASSSTVSYNSGSAYKFTSNKTLYAVWAACSHPSYTGGICDKCGYSFPISVSSISANAVVTKSDGTKIWSKPYSDGSSVNVRRENYNAVLTVNGKAKNAEGNLWYRLTDGNWVFSDNVKLRYTVSYNANGGSGAPANQNVYDGNSLTISSTTPKRVGYVFQGWSTSAGSASVSYKPGSSYKFTSHKTLYAVWSSCPHSSYTGGVCDKCGYTFPISVSSMSGTFVVTNSDGAKIWSMPYADGRSVNVRRESANAVLSVNGSTKNAEGNLWYRLTDGNWVYSGNVTQRYTVSYNANGGSGAPKAQTALSGKSVTVSKTAPAKAGYEFKGWSSSSSASSPSYKGGDKYTVKGNVTLYAVWGPCSHPKYSAGYCTVCGKEYPLSVTSLSASFVVTNSNGAPIWSRPYSSKSTKVRTAANGSVLTVIGSTKNAEGNRWYKLSDGNWVYSGNVAQRYTISYNANGGSNAPKSQTAVDGQALKLSSTKPTRVKYLFQGWSSSADSSTVSYKPGSSYKFTSNKTLYAVWKSCTSHSYSGGICTKCGYEYPLKIKDYSGKFQVVNGEGAPLRSRPYTNNAKLVSTAKDGSVLTVVGYTTNQAGNKWWKLSDGSWVFEDNVKERFTVSYKANGGSGAPKTQYFLIGNSITLSKTKPTRANYRFKGWATSNDARKAKYSAGEKYTFKDNVTLYAVWETCSHSYVGGICKYCGNEYKLTVKDFKGNFKVTNKDGAKVWSRPYSDNAKHIRTEKNGAVLSVVAYTTNQAGNKWWKLSDGNWVYDGSIAQQFSVKFNANGGSGAPKTQTCLKGSLLTLSKTVPTRTGYVFEGWAIAAKDKPVKYAPGEKYSISSDLTLYAVWNKCNHSYKYGVCSKCGYEYPITVQSISEVKCVYSVKNTDGVNSYARPYAKSTEKKTHYKKSALLLVIGKAYNQKNELWYQLSDKTWVKAKSDNSGTTSDSDNLTKRTTYHHVYSIKASSIPTIAGDRYPNALTIGNTMYYEFSHNKKLVYLRISSMKEDYTNTNLNSINTKLTNGVNANKKDTEDFVYCRKEVRPFEEYASDTDAPGNIHLWTIADMSAEVNRYHTDELYAKCTLNSGVVIGYSEYYLAKEGSDGGIGQAATDNIYAKPTSLSNYAACFHSSPHNYYYSSYNRARLYPEFDIRLTESPVAKDPSGKLYHVGYFTAYEVSGFGFGSEKEYDLGDYLNIYSSTKSIIEGTTDMLVGNYAKGAFSITKGFWSLYSETKSRSKSSQYDSAQSSQGKVISIENLVDKNTGKTALIYGTDFKSPIQLQTKNDYIQFILHQYSGKDPQKFNITLKMNKS